MVDPLIIWSVKDLLFYVHYYTKATRHKSKNLQEKIKCFKRAKKVLFSTSSVLETVRQGRMTLNVGKYIVIYS
jgi:hypothetical protein